MKRATQLIVKVSDAIATFAFAGFLCAIVAQVAYRYAGISMVWSEELARLLNVYMVFFGLILVTADGGHLKIDILERSIRSPEALRLLRCAHRVLALVFLLCLAWGGLQLTRSSWDHPLATMAWANHGMFYLPVVIGALVSAALLVLQLLPTPEQAAQPQEDIG
ncbi:TRAP transporter small permease [Salipiger pacificus]|nr:TRAP transporter small permease [Alloyangia pacifica]MCA0946665.1 TRAP transporter small permease [Alloyangia pacifica]